MLMQEIQKLNSELDVIKAKIKILQDQCTHPKEALWEKYQSNTGNYDPTCDCYWIEYRCGICDKFWTKEVK